MPNYRYSSTEYMRRNQSPQSCMQTSPQSCPQTCVKTSACHCDQPYVQNESNTCVQPAKADCPPVLAMAYVKWQEWQCLYEPDKGLSRGTIFEELDKPFKGRGGCCK